MEFLKAFSLASMLFFLLLEGLVLSVDPYNLYGRHWFGITSKAVDAARENKFQQVEHARKNYGALILGSSSAHRYLTADIRRLSGLEAYNYSVQSATPEDYVAILRHFFSHQKPRLVLLSMDFYAMDEGQATDPLFFASPLKAYLDSAHEKVTPSTTWIDPAYFTLEAIVSSLKVLQVNWFGKALHAYLDDGDHAPEPPSTGTVKVIQYTQGPWVLSLSRVERLHEIKRLCQDNGAHLIVFTSPLSLMHLRRLMKDPAKPRALVQFKQSLVDVFGSIWDFENEQSVAPYDTVEFFNNSTHPTSKFSALVLERMLTEGGNKKLGVQLKAHQP